MRIEIVSIPASAVRLYERLQLFQPLGFLFEPGATMPSGALVDIPPCLLCEKQSDLPPSRVGWLRPGRLFLICGDCGFDRDDNEIERRVVTKVSAPVDEMA